MILLFFLTPESPVHGTLQNLFGLLTFRFKRRISGSRFSLDISPSVCISIVSPFVFVCIRIYLP